MRSPLVTQKQTPTYDVEGIDAAQKLVILASLAFGIPFNTEACYVEGISKVAVDDIVYACELGYQIKHLGIARKMANGLELRVHPTLVPTGQLLSQVNGVMNAVYLKGDAVGPTLYYGAGAGSEATASAVLADVIDVAKRIKTFGKKCNNGYKSLTKNLPIIDIDEVESAFYLRINAANHAGVLSQITQLLSESNISVEAMRQRESGNVGIDKASFVPIVLTTNIVKESDIKRVVKALENLDDVSGNVAFIRIEMLD